MQDARRAGIRLAAFANMTLGALAIATIFLASDRWIAIWSAGTVGAGLLLWGAVDAWATWGPEIRGTKLLAMFMAILGVVLAGSSFLNGETGVYRAITIVLGILVVAVSLADAFVSPDEDRRGSFEPRRIDDRSRRRGAP